MYEKYKRSEEKPNKAKQKNKTAKKEGKKRKMRFDRTEKEIEYRRLQNEEFFRQVNLGASDRRYFRRELGSFMVGKRIYHVRDQGDRCLILEIEAWKHRKLHRR